jgi:hypothetical protein
VPCSQFDHYACFPASFRSFSLFQRPPPPPSWRNEKTRLRSCSLAPNPTVTREGPTETKTALETTGSTTIRLRRIKMGVRPLCPVRDQCLSVRANFDTDTLYTRWTLAEIRKVALQRDLPAPEEACARDHCLHQGVEAPELATVKDFFRFYIATSYGRIVAKPTVDSINTNAEWFFAGFTRITGTEINEKDRSEVYCTTLISGTIDAGLGTL